MQKRAVSGVVFENSFIGDGWVRKATSPRLKWGGKGRTIIDKIKSVNYDPELFILDENSNMSKYDIYNTITGGKREVKKYPKDSLKGWSLLLTGHLLNPAPTNISSLAAERHTQMERDVFEVTWCG